MSGLLQQGVQEESQQLIAKDMSLSIEEYERALRVLLRRPGVDFIHGLSSSLDRDPGYLKAHQEAIIVGVKELLDNAGIFWEAKVVKENAIELIRDAVEKARVVEKSDR